MPLAPKEVETSAQEQVVAAAAHKQGLQERQEEQVAESLQEEAEVAESQEGEAEAAGIQEAAAVAAEIPAWEVGEEALLMELGEGEEHLQA